MARATEGTLSDLHEAVAQQLLNKVSDEDSHASWTSIAIKFLKDNEITCSIEDNQDTSALSEKLKEKRAKRRLRVVGDE